MGEGDKGRGSRRICILNPGMFFFFSFLLFFTNIYVQKLFIRPPPAPCTATPAAPPPPLYGVKEVGVKEVGMKGARDADASQAPGISTCTGSLISVE